MSDKDEPVSLRSIYEVVSKQRNPGKRLTDWILEFEFLNPGLDLADGETLKMGDPAYVKDIYHKYKLREYLALKALFDENAHSEDHHPLWFQNSITS